MSISLRHVNWLLAAAHRPLAVNARGTVRWRHSRPEDVGPARRNKMLNRPKDTYTGLTGRTENQELFLASPTSPTMGQGRSDAASKIRGNFKHCNSWQEVMDLVETAKIEGKLEASVLGAAMQTCGNKRWWEGLLQIRQVQQEERVVLFPIQQSIAMTALSHCLKEEGRHRVVAERVQVALEMGKAHWREVEPAGDVRSFNVVLSSVMKLATQLDCEAAYKWGLEVWGEPNERFARNKFSVTAHLAFLEHYRRCDEVDAILARTHAVDVVLLGSLLNCTASHRDWQRAEVLWETFSRREVEPNLMAHNNRAKVHLLAGRPGKVLEIYDHAITDFVSAMREDYKVATIYAQALMPVCHSSLDSASMERLRKFLILSLEKGPLSPKSVTEDLLDMDSVAKTLVSTPENVFLRDILIDWRVKELSVMAEWENFPAGSNYLEGTGLRNDGICHSKDLSSKKPSSKLQRKVWRKCCSLFTLVVF